MPHAWNSVSPASCPVQNRHYLLPVLFASLFLYLAIKGLLTGKVRTSSGTYTKEENSAMFSLFIFGWFMCAFMMFVLLPGAVFEP